MELFSSIVAVKCIFNKLDSQKLVGMELGLGMNQVSGKRMERNEVVAPRSPKINQSTTEKENEQLIDTIVRENADGTSSLGEKPTFSVGVKEASNSNDGLSTMFNDKPMPYVKVEEDEDSKTSLVKQKSSNGKSNASREGLEREKITKTYSKLRKISSWKTTSTSKVGDDGGKRELVGGFARLEGDVKSTLDTNGLVEDKRSKKANHGGSRQNLNGKSKDSMQNRRLVYDHGDDDDDDMKALAPSVTSSKDKRKFQQAKDSSDVEVPSKKSKLDNNPTKLTHGKLHKESSTYTPNVEQKLDSRAWEVTRRPDAVSCIARTFICVILILLLHHTTSIHNQFYKIEDQGST